MRCSDYLNFSVAILRTIAIFRDVTNNEANAKAETMKTFKNQKFLLKGFQATNVIACQAESAPSADWIECDSADVEGLDHLYTIAGVRYFGSL